MITKLPPTIFFFFWGGGEGVTFCEKLFITWYVYFTWSPTSKVTIFFIIFCTKLICVLDLTSTDFIFIVVWRVWWLYILTISTNLLISSFLDIEVTYCQILFFKLLINRSWKQIFLHYVLNAFLDRYFVTMISLTYCKIHYFYQPIFFFWFVTHLNVLKSISNYNAFFSFKGTSLEYLL